MIYHLIKALLLAGFPALLTAGNPTAMVNGLAMYRVGEGEPVFLMPYPHASMRVPMAESELAVLLTRMGRSIISFDFPGSFHSERAPDVSIQEMETCTLETLNHFGISESIDFLGHSMSGFCALAFTIEHQERVKKLVLVGSTSGWPAVKKWSIQKHLREDRKAYRKFMWWGFRLFSGFGNLAVHKKLERVIDYASFVDKSYVQEVVIEKEDCRKPIPVRANWPSYLRKNEVDYKPRLHELDIPVLICVGKHDPQTPVVMNQELHDGIRYSDLVIFENSGHCPHIEEEERFTQIVQRFLNRNLRSLDR